MPWGQQCGGEVILLCPQLVQCLVSFLAAHYLAVRYRSGYCHPVGAARPSATARAVPAATG
jgi:hypothetical protein